MKGVYEAKLVSGVGTQFWPYSLLDHVLLLTNVTISIEWVNDLILHHMEKFSAYRVGATSLPPIYADLQFSRTQEPEYRCILHSTGIFPRWHWNFQPFLTPVPPVGSEFLSRVTLPIRYSLGFIRTILILFIALVYVLLVPGVCLVLVMSLTCSCHDHHHLLSYSSQSPHYPNWLNIYSPLFSDDQYFSSLVSFGSHLSSSIENAGT